MSGRRWIFFLLTSVPIITSGCQVDGGNSKMWNPFARSDKDKFAEEELPKFVRRISDDKKEDAGQVKTPIAESRVDSLLANGQIALQENRIADARRAYQEVLEFLPDNATAHHGMAMAADLSENWTEAESHYRQALRGRPRDANLLCDIGYSYLLQNRYSEASSYLTQAIQINPDHENAHTNLALLDVRQGNPEAARTRLIQRYGDTAKVTQILAALQSQSKTNAASTLAANAPFIPENATLEQIREIANRERIAAEQRRAAQGIPADHNAPTNPISIASHSNAAAPYDSAATQISNATPLINQQAGLNQSAQVNGGGGIMPAHESRSAAIPFDTTGHLQSSDVAQYGQNSNLAPQANQPPQVNQFSGTANQFPTPSNLFPGPANQFPATANTNVNPAYSATANTPITSLNQYPTPGFNVNPQSFADTNSANTVVNQQPFSQTNQTQPTPNPASLSGVIAVRPSGTFQPPAQGVSYGQPIGFSQSAAGSANYQNNGSPSASDGNMAYNNASYGTPQPQNTGGFPNGNSSAPPDSAYGQSNLPMQLDGLNVGPGALFPVGKQNSQQNSQQNGQPIGQQNGTLRMGNVSSPGSNSIINGAMYGQPVSTLPSQEWMMQQQQQIQQLRSQAQSPTQNEQNYQTPMNGVANQNQAAMNSQNVGNNPPNNQYENQGTISAPRVGVPSPPVNPLTAYENQLRQLDNQYNNTLQQLDRNPTAAVPRAQY